MKTLAVFALVCAMMALVRATGLSEAAAEKDLAVKSHVVVKHTAKCRCPSGWTMSKQRCFYFNRTPLTWVGAERTCQSMGGNLASVHKEQEYHKIQKMVLTATHQRNQAWIGGSDAHGVNAWCWSDGTPFSYTKWCVGEPNNCGVQRCLQINHTGEKCWDNVDCSIKLPSICAKRPEGV